VNQISFKLDKNFHQHVTKQRLAAFCQLLNFQNMPFVTVRVVGLWFHVLVQNVTEIGPQLIATKQTVSK